jgi:GTP-binding protein
MSEPDQTDIIETARRIFAGPIRFLLSAPRLKFLPEPVAAEVAFAGRSNVGKSSLINALTNRNGLARTSNTPGRTQELNFFDVGGQEGEVPLFRLVDMPGYGYAKAPKAMVDGWRRLINDYLRGRAVLKRVLVLIDSRHGLKDVDLTLLDMLDVAAVSYRIVLTKADKVKATELDAVAARTAEAIRKRPAAHPEIIATSSEKGMGLPELRAAVIEAVTA